MNDLRQAERDLHRHNVDQKRKTRFITTFFEFLGKLEYLVPLIARDKFGVNFY